jgi:hypothetical protein
MQNFIKICLSLLLFVLSACSFANKSTISVPINSNPPGADVYIDDQYFGQTPVFADLKPSKNYKARISKPGFGSTTIDMETWYSLRNSDGADGKRCVADVASFVLPYMVVLLFAPEKCGSFKQSDYFVDLTGGRPMSFNGSTTYVPMEPGNQAIYGSPYQQDNQVQIGSQYGGAKHKKY